MLEILRCSCLSTCGVAVGVLSIALSRVPIPPASRLGYRGLERQRALAAGGGFALLEPLIRLLAGLASRLPLSSLRARQEQELRRADHCLGLTPDELTGLTLISASFFGCAATLLSGSFGSGPLLILFATVFGLALPTLQVREVIRERTKRVTRGLPHAIEIVALCMGAGLDFPGALRLLAGSGRGRRDPLEREFEVLIEALELGQTRREALLGFADRVPSAPVRDFVSAVVQAEQRGNPLAEVLRIQGRTLNARRSVAAEEAAARAGVLLIAPMLLLVGCIFILLLSPFLVNGVGF